MLGLAKVHSVRWPLLGQHHQNIRITILRGKFSGAMGNAV